MRFSFFQASFFIALSIAFTGCSSSPQGGASNPLPLDIPVPDAETWDGNILTLSGSSNYHVTVTVAVTNSDITLTKLSVLVPLPLSNQYQQAGNYAAASGPFAAAAQVVNIPGTGDQYVRFVFGSNACPPKGGGVDTITMTYDVRLFGVTADLTKITNINPYDTNSAVYKRYTGPSGPYVDPAYFQVAAWGGAIWAQSANLLDYAYRCYWFTATNFSYLDPATGLHPVSELIASGGGDCGNLSSIYISLLRYKNIPARHLVTVRPDGSMHVWADFYLQGYGFIPVDVTYKNGNTNGDYFGKVCLYANGIIMAKSVNLSMDYGDCPFTLSLLQSFAWGYWRNGPDGTASAGYRLSSAPY